MHPEQKISHVIVDKQFVLFYWDKGDPLGGKQTILAPLSCIKELIDETIKRDQGKIGCDTDNNTMNYLGAKFQTGRVEINYRSNKEIKVEIISITSLNIIRKELKKVTKEP